MRLQWNIYGLYVFTFLTYFYLWMPIWIIFLQEKGLSLTSIGILDAVAFLCIALLEIPSGAIADRFGRKYTLAFGAFIYSLGMLFLAITETVSILVLGYLLWHISNTFFSGTNMAFLYDTLKHSNKEEEYQKIAGRLRAVTSVALGSGSLLGGWIAGISITSIFYIIFGLCIISSLIALTFSEKKGEHTTTVKRNLFKVMTNAFKYIGNKPIVKNLLVLSATMSTIPFIVIYVMVQPFAQESKIQIEFLGIIFVMIQVCAIAGSLTSNKLKYFFNERLQFSYIPLIMVFCLFLIPFTPTLVGILCFGLLSFFLSAFSLTLNTKINNLINSNERATILSFMSMLSSIFVVICEPVMLSLYDKVNLNVSLLFSVVVMLITAVPISIYLRNQITEHVASKYSTSTNKKARSKNDSL